MNRIVFTCLFCTCLALLGVPAAAVQPTATPSAAASADPSATPAVFSDPAMSFTAPAGYVDGHMRPVDISDVTELTMVDAYILDSGKNDQRVITISMEPYQGSLSDFDTYSQDQVRNVQSDLFVNKDVETTLSNGMPARWREIALGEGFDQLRRFEYVWVDGVRGVLLSITSKYGQINEQEAKLALQNVSAVAYPTDRQ